MSLTLGMRMRRALPVQQSYFAQALFLCAWLARQQLGSFLPIPNNPPVRHWNAVFSVIGGVSVDRDLKKIGAD